MLEILKSCWTLITGLGESLWGVISLVSVWGWDVLYYLHTTAPRLEGLLVGVALAWIMARREKHALLRVASAPLKLIVDILDLAWDQVVEVARDLWGTTGKWVGGILGWIKTKTLSGYSWVMKGLSGIKDRLVKLTKKEE
jgi:hypothetical protein